MIFIYLALLLVPACFPAPQGLPDVQVEISGESPSARDVGSEEALFVGRILESQDHRTSSVEKTLLSSLSDISLEDTNIKTQNSVPTKGRSVHSQYRVFPSSDEHDEPIIKIKVNFKDRSIETHDLPLSSSPQGREQNIFLAKVDSTEDPFDSDLIQSGVGIHLLSHPNVPIISNTKQFHIGEITHAEISQQSVHSQTGKTLPISDSYTQDSIFQPDVAQNKQYHVIPDDSSVELRNLPMFSNDGIQLPSGNVVLQNQNIFYTSADPVELAYDYSGAGIALPADRSEMPSTMTVEIESALNNGQLNSNVAEPMGMLNTELKYFVKHDSSEVDLSQFLVNQKTDFAFQPYEVVRNEETLLYSVIPDDDNDSLEVDNFVPLGRRYSPDDQIPRNLPPFIPPSIPASEPKIASSHTFNNEFLVLAKSESSEEEEDILFKDNKNIDVDDDFNEKVVVTLKHKDTNAERLGLSDDSIANRYNFVDQQGSVNWGYKAEDHYQNQVIHDDGTKTGEYGWLTPEGKEINVQYTAGSGTGFKILNIADVLPQDEPIVKSAKEDHLKAYNDQLNFIKSLRALSKNSDISSLSPQLVTGSNTINTENSDLIGTDQLKNVEPVLVARNFNTESLNSQSFGVPLPVHSINTQETIASSSQEFSVSPNVAIPENNYIMVVKVPEPTLGVSFPVNDEHSSPEQVTELLSTDILPDTEVQENAGTTNALFTFNSQANSNEMVEQKFGVPLPMLPGVKTETISDQFNQDVLSTEPKSIDNQVSMERMPVVGQSLPATVLVSNTSEVLNTALDVEQASTFDLTANRQNIQEEIIQLHTTDTGSIKQFGIPLKMMTFKDIFSDSVDNINVANIQGKELPIIHSAKNDNKDIGVPLTVSDVENMTHKTTISLEAIPTLNTIPSLDAGSVPNFGVNLPLPEILLNDSSQMHKNMDAPDFFTQLSVSEVDVKPENMHVSDTIKETSNPAIFGVPLPMIPKSSINLLETINNSSLPVSQSTEIKNSLANIGVTLSKANDNNSNIMQSIASHTLIANEVVQDVGIKMNNGENLSNQVMQMAVPIIITNTKLSNVDESVLPTFINIEDQTSLEEPILVTMPDMVTLQESFKNEASAINLLGNIVSMNENKNIIFKENSAELINSKESLNTAADTSSVENVSSGDLGLPTSLEYISDYTDSSIEILLANHESILTKSNGLNPTRDMIIVPMPMQMSIESSINSQIPVQKTVINDVLMTTGVALPVENSIINADIADLLPSEANMNDVKPQTSEIASTTVIAKPDGMVVDNLVDCSILGKLHPSLLPDRCMPGKGKDKNSTVNAVLESIQKLISQSAINDMSGLQSQQDSFIVIPNSDNLLSSSKSLIPLPVLMQSNIASDKIGVPLQLKNADIEVEIPKKFPIISTETTTTMPEDATEIFLTLDHESRSATENEMSEVTELPFEDVEYQTIVSDDLEDYTTNMPNDAFMATVVPAQS